MLKLQYLAKLVDINIKYIASNASLMMSLSVGYPQILASGYPDSKFTIRFSPTNYVAYLPVINMHGESRGGSRGGHAVAYPEGDANQGT